jgi:hypothetical protein
MDLLVEALALLLEAAQLLGAIVVERGVAARLARAAMAMIAAGTAVLIRPGALLVDPGIGLLGRSAEVLTPKDVGEHGEAEGPPNDEPEHHQGDGEGAPLRFDDRSVHCLSTPSHEHMRCGPA